MRTHRTSWGHTLLHRVPALWKQGGFVILALLLLSGCGLTQTRRPSLPPTPHPQSTFPSYVGMWEVHGSQLTIHANHTGLEQWNVGPCSASTTEQEMCLGQAQITLTSNADRSLEGIIQSVGYYQWNGATAPTAFHPDTTDPQAGDRFQLQHSGAHLLVTTWVGQRSQVLNTENHYWCDPYAVHTGWKQCGA